MGLKYFAVLVLTGCAGLPIHDDFYDWYKERDPLPYTTHIIPQAAVQAYCSHTKRFAMACTYWDREQCWIFASTEHYMAMTLLHEKRHCDGWNHQVL